MTRPQWIFLLLLVASICINYIDRGSLSIAGPILGKELSLSPLQLGILYSSFFWTYMSFQPVTGWLVDRYNVNWVYAAGFLIWSGATLVTGMCGAFTTILFVRLILGIGESVAYPSYSKILAGHFREDQRGVANSLVDVGSKTGPAIGVLIGGLFMAEYGWRVFFLAVGTASLLWLIPWSIWAPKDRLLLPREAGEVPTIRQIVTKRAAWGTFFGLLCSNYVWYFMVTWLPSYFTMERHYSQREMAIFGSVPFWGVAAASLTGGWLSDRWIARGGTPNRVRKTFIGTGLMMCTLMLPAAMVRDPKVSMVLLTVACVSYGFFSSNLWAVTQTLAGPWAAGKWTGLQNCIGNIPGIVAPWFTGWVVKETGQFYYAFVAATFFLVAGTFFFLWMVPRVEPVDWSQDKRL